jgi:hypothetical protein
MGYGINEGKDHADWSKDTVVDLMTAEGEVISRNAKTQIHKIKNLKHDWSVMIDENGTQVQTVGHHFKLSQALNQSQLAKLDRRGVCLSCHQNIPDGDLAIELVSHIAKYAPFEIDNEMHSSMLSKILHLSAWIQALIILVIVGFVLKLLIFGRKKRRRW